MVQLMQPDSRTKKILASFIPQITQAGDFAQLLLLNIEGADGNEPRSAFSVTSAQGLHQLAQLAAFLRPRQASLSFCYPLFKDAGFRDLHLPHQVAQPIHKIV